MYLLKFMHIVVLYNFEKTVWVLYWFDHWL